MEPPSFACTRCYQGSTHPACKHLDVCSAEVLPESRRHATTGASGWPIPSFLPSNARTLYTSSNKVLWFYKAEYFPVWGWWLRGSLG